MNFVIFVLNVTEEVKAQQTLAKIVIKEMIEHIGFYSNINLDWRSDEHKS